MNNYRVYYDVKQENGKTIVEKKVYDSNLNQLNYDITLPKKIENNNNSKKVKKHSNTFIIVSSFILLILSISILISYLIFNTSCSKKRTFMIYMVGSDLESNGSFATYDLNDITKSNIDLKNNNVVLMIGGSKKWHNFVDENEIALYELHDNKFEKIENYPVTSMATSKSLSFFLNYVHKNYRTDKYDLIFWNHGLGSVGLESDELSEDFLNIEELDQAFKDSSFNDEKLELVIFNNCLSGNYQFANIMSKYAEYMVGSEEVMYVSSILDRLNFLEKVKVKDNGYDIGKYYVDISDNSINTLNSMYREKYDSTLSIIDLSNMDNLNKSLNTFIDSINLSNNYYGISRARANTYTYARSAQYMYDTVDLLELIDELEPYSSDNELALRVKQEINNTIKFNSAINNHSNGMSIYFPYYGSSSNIDVHLYYFNKLWNDSYTKFITNYYEFNKEKKRSYRSETGSNLNKLSGVIEIDSNNYSIKLNDKEKSNYQRANFYLFKKLDDNNYALLLKSNNVKIENGVLSYKLDGITKSGDEIISLVEEDDNKYIYTSINEVDTKTNIEINNSNIKLLNSIYDSVNLPNGGIIERSDNIDYYQLRYSINDDFYDYYLENIEKIKVDRKEIKYLDELEEEYYTMIEYFDINNDSFFTDITKIN